MPRKGNKHWQHPADALLSGHVVYSVKFLGDCSVDHPKGIDIVKDAVKKMKFNRHIRKSEGQKLPKVEMVISAEAVVVIDPKIKLILFRFPLHLISYCAEDRTDKRMFAFIAKEASGHKHFCYVFDSDKCAEEITITIGQAFELAYKKFLETSSSNNDMRKQFFALQRKVQSLQYENDVLCKRVADLEKLKDRADIEEYKRNNKITDLHVVNINRRKSSTDDDLSPGSVSDTQDSKAPSFSYKMPEKLTLKEEKHRSPTRNNDDVHTTFVSFGSSSTAPMLSPPPVNCRPIRANSLKAASTDSSTPETPGSNSSPKFESPANHVSHANIDLFGMEVFNPLSLGTEQQLLDIQMGFSKGLSFGKDDFNLDDFDPLSQK